MRANDERRYSSKAAKVTAQPVGKRPFTFHPTTEQRQILTTGTKTTAEVLLGLEEWVNLGHRITIGRSEVGGSLYAVIRDGHKEWSEAQAVFVYHNDLAKALTGLLYFLDSVAPEFPSIPALQTTFLTDW